MYSLISDGNYWDRDGKPYCDKHVEPELSVESLPQSDDTLDLSELSPKAQRKKPLSLSQDLPPPPKDDPPPLPKFAFEEPETSPARAHAPTSPTPIPKSPKSEVRSSTFSTKPVKTSASPSRSRTAFVRIHFENIQVTMRESLNFRVYRISAAI